MTWAGWIASASVLTIIVSSLTCGWLGVSAVRGGRRWLGIAILAIPIVFTLGVPMLAEATRFGASDPTTMIVFHVAGFLLTPAVTLLALLTSRRYLAQ
jgi:sugar phosphate permease